MSQQVTKQRFIKIEDSCLVNYKVKNWRLDPLNPYGPHDSEIFLSKLWSLYGEPHEVNYEGFNYFFWDTELNICLNVYHGASGPAFATQILIKWDGGLSDVSEENIEQSRQSVDAFERLLGNAELVDCSINYRTDFGRYRIGVHKGKPFEKDLFRLNLVDFIKELFAKYRKK